MRILPAILVLGLSACRSTTPIQEINEKYRNVLLQRRTQYRIREGDIINVFFYMKELALDQRLTVLPDGRTDPFFMDDVVVAGKTVKELEGEIEKYYAEQIDDPEISIQIEPAADTIIVEGQVIEPRPQLYRPNMTLLDALGSARGYRLTARLPGVIIRRSYLNHLHPDVYQVDLSSYSEVPEDLLLLPGDHIIVKRNWLIMVRDYLDEYVWGFLPPFMRNATGVVVSGAIYRALRPEE